MQLSPTDLMSINHTTHQNSGFLLLDYARNAEEICSAEPQAR